MRNKLYALLDYTTNVDSYRIEDKERETDADIYIYDIIDYWGMSSRQFLTDISKIKKGVINVHINSPGGSVFEGVAIYNTLKQHKARIKVYIEGLAASIAALIAMSGDEIYIAENAFMMIHNPYTIALGDSSEMRKTADLLDKITETIAETLAKRSKSGIKGVLEAMEAETWYNGKEAVEEGLADGLIEISPEDTEKTKNRFDLSVYNNVPEELLVVESVVDGEIPDKRTLEKYLRDAGCTRNQAKTILARGFGSSKNEMDVSLWASAKKLELEFGRRL